MSDMKYGKSPSSKKTLVAAYIALFFVITASIAVTKYSIENKDKCTAIIRQAYGKYQEISFNTSTTPQELKEKIEKVLKGDGLNESI